MTINGNSYIDAKELFFKYDGSRFYMSRDGVEEKYLNYQITEKIEHEWRVELNRLHRSQYIKKGNFKDLYYLLGNDQIDLQIIFREIKGSFINKLIVIEIITNWFKQYQEIYDKQVKREIKVIIKDELVEMKKNINKYKKNNATDRVLEIEKSWKVL